MLVLEGQGLLSQERERECDQVTQLSRLYLGTAHVAICLSVCHPTLYSSVYSINRHPSFLPFTYYPSLLLPIPPSLPPSLTHSSSPPLHIYSLISSCYQ